MNNQITSAGWVGDLMRCDHLDPDAGDVAWFAVNLIAPQGSRTDSWPHADPDKTKFTAVEVKDQLGALLTPWLWEGSRRWRLFGFKGGQWHRIDDIAVTSGTQALDSTQARALEQEYWKEIVGSPPTMQQQARAGRSTGCLHAFSFADELWQGQPNLKRNTNEPAIFQQSFVHALAPIAHTPASLSNELFRFAGFLAHPSADLQQYEKFTAFPVVTLGGQEYAAAALAPHPQDARAVVATYDPPKLGDIALVFQSFAIDGQPNKLGVDKVFHISYGAPARDVVGRLIAGHGMPLEILADALDQLEYVEKVEDGRRSIEGPDKDLLKKDPFPQDAWIHALVRNLGAGWFRRRADNSRRHVLQYAASGSDIDDLQSVFPQLEATFKEPEAGTAVDSVKLIDGLREALGRHKDQLSVEDGLFLEMLEELRTAVEPLAKNQRLDQARKFFGAWTRIAREFMGDRRVDVVRMWLSSIIRARGHSNDPEKQEAVERIVARLTTLIQSDSADRLLLGAVDSAGAAQLWRSLNELAEIAEALLKDEDEAAEQETQKQEQRVADQIRAWCMARFAAILEATLQPSKVESALGIAMSAMLEEFRTLGRRRVRREYDDSLLVRFDAGENQQQNLVDLDEKIRGHAVALRSGVTDAQGQFHPDEDHAAWVTNTCVLFQGQFLETTAADAADMAGAVGSADYDGQRVVQFPYRGGPVYASAIGTDRLALTDEDPDEFQSFDYRALQSTRFPLLGFGSEFQGACTAIDNAGGIVSKQCRHTTHVALTRSVGELKDVFSKMDRLPYRSCVPPGAPRLNGLVGYADAATDKLSSFDPWELTDQVRAVRFVSQSLKQIGIDFAARPREYQQATRTLVASGAIPRVACVVPRSAQHNNLPLYSDSAPRDLDLRFAPPLATKDFVRSWLLTDCMQLHVPKASRQFSDPNLAAFSSAEDFEKFVLKLTDKRAGTGRASADGVYHPAVTAIGVEFDFLGRFTPLRRLFVVKRTEPEGNGVKILSETFAVRVLSDAVLEPVHEKVNEISSVLKLPPATFVRVRCYSLVENRFFEGDSSLHRFFKGIAPAPSTSFPGHREFGPLELWVESLPTWKTPADVRHLLKPKVERYDDESVRLVCEPAADLTADWLRSVSLNRHAWHWTGYPVRFPTWDSGEELKSWLPAFAGVESNREQIVLVLPTRVDAVKVQGKMTHAWRLGLEPGPFVLHEQRLRNGERPSQYAAYTAKVAVRFSSWLNPKLQPRSGSPKDLESEIFAAGNAIEGIGAFDESQRLPAPAFEHRIPLTASYMYDSAELHGGLPLGRSVNGNLLIFKAAIRRTDSFAKAGGLGDTIEVDLLQARTLSEGEIQLSQIGPNPIFHPSPADDHGTMSPEFLRCTLEASEPHGLTYDLVRNAKVAQTAILVRPAVRKDDRGVSIEEASTEWQLAQVRVRRLILPETQLNSRLPQLASIGNAYRVPWRRDGVERIPYDFALDFDAGTVPALELVVPGFAPSYKLKLPSFKAEAGLRVRALVSFHKGRWKSDQPPHLPGIPYWAPQVHVQIREKKALGWNTIAKETCYGKTAWTASSGEVHLTVGQAANVNAYCVQMSDYTDARWLLFIGRIAGTGRQPPEEYLLTPTKLDNGKQGLRLDRGHFGNLRGPPLDRSDWTEKKTTEFFVLFVSSPPSDVMSGSIGPAYHGLLAYRPVKSVNDDDSTLEFELMSEMGVHVTNDLLPGSAAVLCSFQHITSPSQGESDRPIDTFPKLIEAIFPQSTADQWRPRESIVRPTGNHWGPMRIGAAAS